MHKIYNIWPGSVQQNTAGKILRKFTDLSKWKDKMKE